MIATGRRSTTTFGTAACAVALFLAACGTGSDDAPDTAPPGAAPTIMDDWLGCDVFDDLQPIRDYLGVTGTDGLQSDSVGEGIDAEAAGCSGLFDLATFEDVQGTFDYRVTGDAAIRAGLAPWADEAAAAENFRDRVDTRLENLPGIRYVDEQEADLGGEWDDGFVIVADTEHRTYIDAFARRGTWVVAIAIDYLHDPGVGAYESAPDFYPDATAEELAVYPFTPEQVVDWLTREYLPRLQSDIITRAESE